MSKQNQATFSVNANSNNKVKSRTCIFINSNDPSMKNQVINDPKPFIKPPFPPSIDPRDLINLLPNGKTSKAPNAFLVYRKAFIDAARNEGYALPMTVVSTMASQSWEQEPEVVKNEYKQLAKDAFDYRNEIVPKSERRRKREKWNIITFSKPSHKTPISKSQRSENKQIIELPSPPISSPEPEIDLTFIKAIQTAELHSDLIPELSTILAPETELHSDLMPELSRILTPELHVPSNLTSELFFESSSNSDVIAECTNFFSLSSPDLSISGNSSPELNIDYEFNIGITSPAQIFADTQVQIEQQPQIIWSDIPPVNNIPLFNDTHGFESSNKIAVDNSLIGYFDFQNNSVDTAVGNLTFPSVFTDNFGIIHQNNLNSIDSYEIGFDYSFLL